jgi:hypothetical protein
LEYDTHKSRWQQAFFSSNKRIKDFSAASPWCKKDDPIAVGSSWAYRGGPQGLLRHERGPTSGMATILNKSSKALKVLK